jgi:hypothetical protein
MKNKRFTDAKADILMMFCQLIMQPFPELDKLYVIDKELQHTGEFIFCVALLAFVS